MSDSGNEPGEEDLLAVGKVLGPHGIRGAVIVKVISDFPGRFHQGARLQLGDPRETLDEVVVRSSSPHKGNLLVYLDGVDDRGRAERLRGRYLWIAARQAAPLEDGEYWAHELVGMEVCSEDGCPLGEVEEFVERPLQDLLTVTVADGRTFQLPFVGEFVKRIDTARRTITVRLPQGMEPG